MCYLELISEMYPQNNVSRFLSDVLNVYQRTSENQIAANSADKLNHVIGEGQFCVLLQWFLLPGNKFDT